jgi:cytochrome P450
MEQTLDELLMVNLDAITHVLGWLITLIAGHADIRRELQDEIEANRGNLDEYIGKTETHLHRCLYESIRIRPFSSELTLSPTSENWRADLTSISLHNG